MFSYCVWRAEQVCGASSPLTGSFWATQIPLRGVASFIVDHRARMTGLNIVPHTGHRFTHRKKVQGHMGKRRTHTHTEMLASVYDNLISSGSAHTHSWDHSRWKRVWNESEMCCTVGRLSTHDWAPESGHGPSLRAGQCSTPGRLETISCVTQRWISVDLCGWWEAWPWVLQVELFRFITSIFELRMPWHSLRIWSWFNERMIAEEERAVRWLKRWELDGNVTFMVISGRI